MAVTAPGGRDHVAAAAVAQRSRRLADRAADHVLIGATPDGRDVAGILSALLGWGVLVERDRRRLGRWRRRSSR